MADLTRGDNYYLVKVYKLRNKILAKVEYGTIYEIDECNVADFRSAKDGAFIDYVEHWDLYTSFDEAISVCANRILSYKKTFKKSA